MRAWPLLLLALLAPGLAAGEAAPAPAPAWDYLPLVGYVGDGLWFSLRVPGASEWSARSPAGQLAATASTDGQTVSTRITPPAQPAGEEWIELAGGGQHLRVRLVRPGGGAKLRLDSSRRLRQGDDAAVLVVDRTEADADRRWKIFRALSTADPVPCELTLEAPAVPSGESGLLAELCAAQGVEVSGKSLLVLLPASDRSAGWKHREYRQTVAWLVSDALTRGASHVVLAGPVGPAADAAALTPLVREAQDVALAYHCRHLELAELRADANWTLADGIIGPDLNATGKAALAKALAGWQKR